jgi:hypothetical protein
MCKDIDSHILLAKVFELLIDRFQIGPTNNNQNPKQADYFKALAYEMYILYIAPFVRARDYTSLAVILHQKLRLNLDETGSQNEVLYTKLIQPILLMAQRAEREKRRSVIADWIYSRRQEGRVGSTEVGWIELMESDLLLLVYSLTFPKEGHRQPTWIPWSSLYARYEKPLFLSTARRKEEAEKLRIFLTQQTIEELRKFIIAAGQRNNQLMGDIFLLALFLILKLKNLVPFSISIKTVLIALTIITFVMS